MKRHYSMFRSALHIAVACVLVPGMPRLTPAQVRLPPNPPVTTNPTKYTLTDLNLLAYTQAAYVAPGTPAKLAYAPWFSEADAINNAGQVVGVFQNFDGAYHGFRTQPNMPINYLFGSDDLGVLKGFPISQAYAVNDSGVAVGDSGISAFIEQISGPCPGCSSAAFRSAPGTAPSDLNPSIFATATELGNRNNIGLVHASGINNAGAVVGYFTDVTSPQVSHSFLSSGPGSIQRIDSWYNNPASSQTVDVNNLGQVVGMVQPRAGDSLITVLCNTGGGMVKIPPLPGGQWNLAYALNDSGQVVGQSNTASNIPHAFRYQNGVLEDLDPTGGVPSGALSVNAGGVAVGYFGSRNELCDNRLAAVFGNNRATNLNNLVQGGTGDWTLRVARGINDHGQIVGFMQNSAGTIHAFRLDPIL